MQIEETARDLWPGAAETPAGLAGEGRPYAGTKLGNIRELNNSGRLN